MMRKIFFSLFLSLSIISVINAQENLSSDDIQIIVVDDNKLNEGLKKQVQNIESSTVILKQQGNYNEALINQNTQNNYVKNYVEINQIGISHNTLIDIDGGGNGIRVNQMGIDGGNTYFGEINGNDNIIDVTQTGNRNRIKQTIAFVDELNFSIVQSGSENILELINNNGSVTPNLIIEQKGNGMEIKIENNVMLPLKK